MRAPIVVAALAMASGLSCKTNSPTVHPEPPLPAGAPRVEPDPDRPVEPNPAFVVLTEDSTWVIAVDPGRELLQLRGHFVGGQTQPQATAHGRWTTTLTTEGDSPETIEVCPRGDFEDACVIDPEFDTVEVAGRVRLLADGRARQTLPCTCAVVVGVSTDGQPEPEFDITEPDIAADIEMSPYTPEDYVNECSDAALEPDLAITSILAGVVYETGMAHNNVCSGLNIYDAAERHTVLREGAEPLRAEPVEGMMCLPDGLFDGLEPSLASLAEGECAFGDEDCDCDDVGEMSAFAIRRGELVHITGNISPAAGGCACVGRQPLSAGNCPAPTSPCGRGLGFEELAEWPEYWVTTDETLALAMTEDLFAVMTPSGDTVRSGELDGPVLGVEFHADTALVAAPVLPDEVRVAMPALHPDDEGFDGSARRWGNRCFSHLKAGRIDAAEAACFEGLREGGTDGTRGALTYNLGRVAEARGRRDRAMTYYQRSAALRPGNAAVQERLAALSAE